MRLLRYAGCCCAALVTSVAALRPLAAQSYTPRQIRFEGGGDPAELLRITGLKPGAPVSKAQIEAAMGKLAETGAFTDLSYTVSADALVIKLGGAVSSSGQALPVRYMNLVWWQPDELTKLLKQRVPLFRGELPLTGTLTDQVRVALVQLLAERGIPNAKVDALPTTLGGGARGVSAIALNVSQPEIVLGRVALPGAAPVTQQQLDAVTGKLTMQEFATDLTAKEIRDNVGDTEKNAGFLDATVDPPVFSAPRPDMNGFAMDASATVHPGELYRIGTLDLGAKPPLSQADAENAAGLKTGEPAGAMAVSIALGRMQREYGNRGYLSAKVQTQTTLDHVTHTAAIRFSVEPGELYHLDAIDTTALPADLQAGFGREFRGKPGMDAGLALSTEITRTLRVLHAPRLTMIVRGNPARHTVTVVLAPENVPHVIVPPSQ